MKKTTPRTKLRPDPVDLLLNSMQPIAQLDPIKIYCIFQEQTDNTQWRYSIAHSDGFMGQFNIGNLQFHLIAIFTVFEEARSYHQTSCDDGR